MRLLVTRPEPEAERTAAALRAHGHEVMLAPMLRIEPDSTADLGGGPFAAVVITSANAVRALALHPRRSELIALPLYAVGARSAEAARAAGFAAVVSADKDVAALAALIGARHRAPTAPLLYLAAEDRAGDLAAALAPRGIAVRTVVLYRAVMADALPAPVRSALAAGTLEGVLHFSRRTAQAYLDAARAAALRDAALAPVQLCLSPETAAPLAAAGAATIRIAPQPDEAALLGLI